MGSEIGRERKSAPPLPSVVDDLHAEKLHCLTVSECVDVKENDSKPPSVVDEEQFEKEELRSAKVHGD